MARKKKEGTDKKPVLTLVGEIQKTCRGFNRYGAPCKEGIKPDKDFCSHHENDEKQGWKEEQFRAIVEGRRRKGAKTIVSIPREWLQVEAAIRDGLITMEEYVRTLDSEELVRGQIRKENGVFYGAPPTYIPRAFYTLLVAELLRRGREIYHGFYLDAINVFGQVINNEELDPKLRLEAAKYVWERVEGKVPERVEVRGTSGWEDLMTEAFVTEEEMIEQARERLRAKGELA